MVAAVVGGIEDLRVGGIRGRLGEIDDPQSKATLVRI
jgi:hypothetical protein